MPRPAAGEVGPQGSVVGIEESPEMVAVARERIAAEGWPNVTVVQSPAEDAKIPVTADAALFCAVHDILQSPGALQNIMSSLRPGGWVAAGGGKWAPWAMMTLNLQVRMMHAPYVRNFAGFGRPWNHLEELIEDIDVREVALGSARPGCDGRTRRFSSFLDGVRYDAAMVVSQVLNDLRGPLASSRSAA